jgi:hypothetical protein
VYDVSYLLGRKRLLRLEKNSGGFFDIRLGEEVVILRENEAIRFAAVCSDRFIVSAKAEFFNIADPFNVMTEFPQIINRRQLDVFVSEDEIPH